MRSRAIRRRRHRRCRAMPGGWGRGRRIIRRAVLRSQRPRPHGSRNCGIRLRSRLCRRPFRSCVAISLPGSTMRMALRPCPAMRRRSPAARRTTMAMRSRCEVPPRISWSPWRQTSTTRPGQRSWMSPQDLTRLGARRATATTSSSSAASSSRAARPRLLHRSSEGRQCWSDPSRRRYRGTPRTSSRATNASASPALSRWS
mmetsp:Transcript_122722/g.393006  ORF Transcript_122722/g.393006 Transcript_122722/m.393006 type:complete len:201 (-) Transcript_122722:962-1564(-)